MRLVMAPARVVGTEDAEILSVHRGLLPQITCRSSFVVAVRTCVFTTPLAHRLHVPMQMA